jgi:hypothetical protein
LSLKVELLFVHNEMHVMLFSEGAEGIIYCDDGRWWFGLVRDTHTTQLTHNSQQYIVVISFHSKLK